MQIVRCHLAGFRIDKRAVCDIAEPQLQSREGSARGDVYVHLELDRLWERRADTHRAELHHVVARERPPAVRVRGARPVRRVDVS